jgi:hypothetical protein
MMMMMTRQDEAKRDDVLEANEYFFPSGASHTNYVVYVGTSYNSNEVFLSLALCSSPDLKKGPAASQEAVLLSGRMEQTAATQSILLLMMHMADRKILVAVFPLSEKISPSSTSKIQIQKN